MQLERLVWKGKFQISPHCAHPAGPCYTDKRYEREAAGTAVEARVYRITNS